MSNSNVDQFDQIWQVAIKRYEKIIHKKFNNLNLKNLENIIDFERVIDQKNDNIIEFKTKRSSFAQRIDFCQIIDQARSWRCKRGVFFKLSRV